MKSQNANKKRKRIKKQWKTSTKNVRNNKDKPNIKEKCKIIEEKQQSKTKNDTKQRFECGKTALNNRNYKINKK